MTAPPVATPVEQPTLRQIIPGGTTQWTANVTPTITIRVIETEPSVRGDPIMPPFTPPTEFVPDAPTPGIVGPGAGPTPVPGGLVPGLSIAPASSDPCAGASTGGGTYTSSFCLGQDIRTEGPNGMTQGIGCYESLENCLVNAFFNPNLSLQCEFNGDSVFDREFEPGLCEGRAPAPEDHCVPPEDNPCPDFAENGDLQAIDCNTGEVFEARRGEACALAVGACLSAAYLDPNANVKCTLDGREIYRSESTPGACGA